MAASGENSTTRLSSQGQDDGATSGQTLVSTSLTRTDQRREQNGLCLSSEAHIGICIDPVALITQECITITSAMRKHARWAQSSVAAILGGAGSASTSGVSAASGTSLRRAALQQSQDPERSSSPRTSISGQPGVRSGSRTPRIEKGQGVSRSGSLTGRPTVSTGGVGSIKGRGSLSDDEDNTSLASRWGLRGKKGRSVQDNPLLSAFSKLRRDLAGCKDIADVDAPTLLHPFLQVIRSSSTSAAITSLAVISITKFFSYNLITRHSPRIALAMHLLSAAITHCRFEASDTAADEVVLLRILRLMELTISRPEGSLLGDESICEMMSTGLSMCCQARLSEVLRRSAEMAMVTMCQIVFSRLNQLEVENPWPADTVPNARSRSNTVQSMVMGASEEVKIQPPLDGSVMGNGAMPRSSTDDRAAYEAPTSPRKKESVPGSGAGQGNNEDDDDDDEALTPYALPSIRELFRVLVDLLDPHSKQHTDPMRVIALRIIDVALEVAGPAIAAQPTLAVLVEDDLCRHLFQLVRSENMVLLNSSLRAASTLLATCRKLLKLQQELFLSYLVACLHPKVDIPQEPGIDPSLYEGVPQAPKLVKPAPSQPSSGRSTPVPVKDRRQLGLEGGQRRPEAREAMVESIGTLIRMPAFMGELFVNYDCDVDRQDLCEDMVGLLSRNAFPDAATWSTTNVPPLCLDSLLSFIEFMADRADQPMPEGASARLEELSARRNRKKYIKAGAVKFNDEPKAGIAYLVRNGIIGNPDDPKQIARFLKSTTHVSKKMLGEYISKKSNVPLLTAFIDAFDFSGQRIDEALRDLLTSFRLPGESALIERIVNVFCDRYLGSDVPPGVADKDSGFVLTYAIIMLNTDLYNTNIKTKRMGYEDFARNLRGCNAGQDFAPEYLQSIFDAIKQEEIVLPDEHDNKNAFEFAWKSLLMKTHDAGRLELCDTNIYDAEMFKATWKPMIATLCYVFMSASDDAVFARVVVGFDQCAQLASRYGVPEAFDRIVHSLSQISSLAPDVPPSTSLNTEIQAGKRRIMVSELAVRLGRDFRAQLSAVLLFRILNGHESSIGKTWLSVVRILKNLFVNSLITVPRFASGRLSDLGPIPLQPPAQVVDRDGKLGESGLFSTLTSYLSSYAADDPPEPSEEELDNTLSTVDCIKACKIEEVMAHMFSLPTESVEILVQALLSELPDAPSPVVVVKPDVRPAPVTARMNGHRHNRNGPDYQPGAMFLLELATQLALRDEATMVAVGESLNGILQAAVRDASNTHPLAASRMVRRLLDLLRYGYHYDFMRAPVVLHAISSFNDTTLDQTAPAVLQGFSTCIAEAPPLRNDITSSPDFWSILQRLHQHKTEADTVFSILSSLSFPSSSSSASAPTSSSHRKPSIASQGTAAAAVSGITADNYEAAVSLASEFASAGSIGSIQEQRRDLAARRGQKARPPRPEDAAVVSRGLNAINIIHGIGGHATSILITQSHLERHEAWAAYWSPIFRALCAQCVNPCREIRHRALSALQRTLLSEDLAHQSEEHTEWTAIFREVLFPLTLRLLKPEVHQLDGVGMAETRVQLATLLCKIFLRYMDQLYTASSAGGTGSASGTNQEETDSKGVRSDKEKSADNEETSEGKLMLDIWTKVLDLLDRLMNASVGTKEGEALEEAVGEGVKNVLLVMAGSGYLVPPSPRANPSGDRVSAGAGARVGVGGGTSVDSHVNGEAIKERIWIETGRRLERFLPGLMKEVFPPPPPASGSASASASPTTTSTAAAEAQ